MCEFCLKHGEGEKWYLQAKNYSDDLLSDARRRNFITDFFSNGGDIAQNVEKLAKLDEAPDVIKQMVRHTVTRRMKKNHFGQVVPIEDIARILDFMGSIVRVACFCRHSSLGEEKRYCYGISMSPAGGELSKIFRGLDNSFINGPDSVGVEKLTKEQALESMREHEKEGLCHTIWTFGTPFIGGICNCDRTDCFAMRCTVTHDVPVMFRAEYVAETDPDKCNGCRACMRLCQFGAIGYSASNKKTVIDQRWCYGCGICRSACTKNAIELKPRKEVPAAANRW